MIFTDVVEPIERSVFSSRNPEETTEFFRQMYGSNRTAFDHVKPHSGVTANSAGFGVMRADRLQGGLTMRITADPLGYILFGQLRRGRWTLRSDGQERRLGPQDSVLYPSDTPFQLEAHNFDFRVVCLSRDRVAALAASHTGIDPIDLRFDSMAPVSAAMANYLGRTVAFIHRELGDAQSGAVHSLVAEQLAQTAAAAVLSVFPNTTMTVGPPSGAGKVAPAALRRAVAYIDAHVADSITLADIAAASGATGRAVQIAFRHHYGVTPMAYLRRARLDGAHRDLQAANPAAGDTVAGIAGRWGFSHAARFTTFYHEQFGVLPQHTLRT